MTFGIFENDRASNTFTVFRFSDEGDQMEIPKEEKRKLKTFQLNKVCGSCKPCHSTAVVGDTNSNEK